MKKNLTDINLPEKEDQEIKIFHIPLILFEGLSQNFGNGNKNKIGDHDVVYLKQVDDLINFPGVIGLSTHSTGCVFSLWVREPSGSNMMYEAPLILRIWALENHSGGSYTSEQYLVREEINAKIGRGVDSLSLENPACDFALFILAKAREIIKSRNYKPCESFWVPYK
ncbi:MAG: hypothetical protein PHX25_03785 [Candidatus Pacebacteria bacterium]|nr:hypothetical protein [Candidatus Paceibacterota bacterium]